MNRKIRILNLLCQIIESVCAKLLLQRQNLFYKIANKSRKCNTKAVFDITVATKLNTLSYD